jgi:hypothetical protein
MVWIVSALSLSAITTLGLLLDRRDRRLRGDIPLWKVAARSGDTADESKTIIIGGGERG